MDYTITLRVSANALDLEAASPPLAPPRVGYREGGVVAPGAPPSPALRAGSWRGQEEEEEEEEGGGGCLMKGQDPTW